MAQVDGVNGSIEKTREVRKWIAGLERRLLDDALEDDIVGASGRKDNHYGFTVVRDRGPGLPPIRLHIRFSDWSVGLWLMPESLEASSKPQEACDANEWFQAVELVREWAARHGLGCAMETDPTLGPEFDSTFLSVACMPYSTDSTSCAGSGSTVASLMRRYAINPVTSKRHGPPTIGVYLVRRGCSFHCGRSIKPHELARFGLEAQHMDHKG